MSVVENRRKFFLISFAIVLCGIVAMIYNVAIGKNILNYDIDFTGGTSIEIGMDQEFKNSDLEKIIEEITGQTSPQIQKIVGSNDVLIRMQTVDEEKRNELIASIQEEFDLDSENILNIYDVSGTISGEMQRLAINAVLMSCVAMLIYISFRFKDFKMGISTILALVHDVIIMISFYAILRIPVNNAFIAALLTVLGYSINATIVIFDRIRENKGNYRKNQTSQLINKSINQTLGRSINTSLTTMFTITVVYIIGVQAIKEFALPIMIGIISGTYSSIFLSGSLWYMMLPEKER